MLTSFTECSPAAREFFDEHGWVVFTPRFSQEECAALCAALDALQQAYAQEQHVPIDEYLALISQWRDLWRSDEAFRRTLFDARLSMLAAELMGRSGARLLHDHVISKPCGRSDTVPWHQDFPYWPVSPRGGLSCWMPLEDVDAEGGCLEIVDGSHRYGESQPVDFIAESHPELDARADRVRLPATAGSVVVLHSLTWHRTGPNTSGGRRRAYITLWLPPDARYAPTHAAWHPTNEHVSVQPGEILNNDWFPVFGAIDRSPDGPEAAPISEGHADAALSMFTASQTIAGQLRSILQQAGYQGSLTGGIGALLRTPEARDLLVTHCLQAGLLAPCEVDALRQLLVDLLRSAEAYRLHRARNVYNEAYVRWWGLVGERWTRHASPREPV